MTEDQIKHITNLNERLLLLLGFASSVILELDCRLPEDRKASVYWIIEAIENAVYLDRPLPPFPEK